MIYEYIWLNHKNQLCKKTKVIHDAQDNDNKDGKKNEHKLELSLSTFTSDTGDELILKPCAIFKDPFRGKSNMIVLCEVMDITGGATKYNTRFVYNKTIEDTKNKEEIIVGVCQELVVGKSEPDLEQYRNHNSFIEKCLECGINAGIKMSGYKSSGSSKHEIALTCNLAEAPDNVVILRYIIEKLSYLRNISVSYSSTNITYSTKQMREKGGYTIIKTHIDKLHKGHDNYVKLLNKDSQDRVSRLGDISNTFSSVGTTQTCIRIPSMVDKLGIGYLEDRRYAGEYDPYLAILVLHMN